jgi:hypothetical protein
VELGVGLGCEFCGTAAATLVPGGIRPRHRRLDAGSHGPGPVLVGGVAQKPPAPHGHDGQAVVASVPLQAHHRSCGWREHLARPQCGARGRMMVSQPPRGVDEPAPIIGLGWAKEYSKMTILLFKQLMLESFGAKRTRRTKSPSQRDGLFVHLEMVSMI